MDGERVNRFPTKINNTLVVKVSSLCYGPFLNPCDVILLGCTYTDRLMGKCVRYHVDCDVVELRIMLNVVKLYITFYTGNPSGKMIVFH